MIAMYCTKCEHSVHIYLRYFDGGHLCGGLYMLKDCTKFISLIGDK